VHEIPQFDAFIAIDWSGAARHYDGIAAAMCEAGRSAPTLIDPPARHWSRSTLAKWLEDRLRSGRRLLIGLDFAFGFPFEPGIGYLGGKARRIRNIFSLWSLIETKSGGEADFGCARFISDPDYEQLFWKSGKMPEQWIARKRRTEYACADATHTRPDTPYKLLHSKQVGKASITGIRVLHKMRSRNHHFVAIWPFETVSQSAIVEIYPTLFRKIATGSIAKLRSLEALNPALTKFSSRTLRYAESPDLSDHETDALLSAAGLRFIANDPRIWSPDELNSKTVQREGWIFGCNARFGSTWFSD
jgi:hypothetical protein